jgi:Late competence development protein ComFB
LALEFGNGLEELAMLICRNVVEELVIEESRLQFERLGAGVQQQVRMSDVVAHALNHLPTMYATNQRGWTKQRQKASNELGKQIGILVHQAIVTMSNSPVRNTDPLPLQLFATPERSLDRLQKIIRKQNLTWKDAPTAVAGAIITANQIRYAEAEPVSTVKTPQSAAAKSIKAYLQRQARKDGEPSIKTLSSEKDLDKEFERYMLRANCGYINVLENLVMEATDRQMQRLNPEVAKILTVEEVSAYALNRLPAMYATSDLGYRQLRLRVKEELKTEVITKIREGILKMSQSPMRRFLPSPFEQFDQQQEEAIAEIKEYLKLAELDWRTLPEVIADILHKTREGDLTWYQLVREARGAVV